MATRVKPNRMKSENQGTLSDALSYKDQSTFRWEEVRGDMKYADFYFETKTGQEITLGLSTKVAPSSNFSILPPAELKDGQVYLLRVENGSTAYQMTLANSIQNPYGVDLALTPNWTDEFVFLAVDGRLELQPATGTFYLGEGNLTITQGGATRGTFNANESSNKTIDVTENEFVDESNFDEQTADNSKIYFIFGQ